MATTNIQNFNVKPYHDDFDETKNYHRILFRPGFSVQARELTQLQTALQAQIDRHGQYFFKDGSRVIGGKVTLDVNRDFVKVETNFTHSGTAYDTSTYHATLIGTTFTGLTSGNKATVVGTRQAETVGAIDGGTNDPITLFLKYTKGNAFTGGEVLQNNAGTAQFAKVKPNSDTPTGVGSALNIEEGAYFIRGTYVYVPSETLILSKYDNTPNFVVGLKVTESSLVDSSTDSTLLDNADGTPNLSAPGARRYQIKAELAKQLSTIHETPSGRTEDNFIVLMNITDGIIQRDKTDKTEDTQLTKRLERRTFEESGDYTVNTFQVNIRQHLDDTAGNNGVFTSGNGGDATKLVAAVEPGVAYVKGTRIQKNVTEFVPFDKPRDLKLVENDVTTLKVGNYLKLTENTVKGIPDVNTFISVDLHSVNIAGTQSGSNKIGTARVRGLGAHSSGVKRLYVFDIKMTGSNTISQVLSVRQTDAIGSQTRFIGDINGTAQLFDVGNKGLIFELPYNAVKSIRSINSANNTPLTKSDTTYTVYEKLVGTTGGSDSVVTFAAPANGAFTNIANAYIYASGGSRVIKLLGTTTGAISGGGKWELDGTSLKVNLAHSGLYNTALTSNSDVQIIVEIAKSYAAISGELTKATTTNQTKTGTLTNGRLVLDKCDIKRLVSVTDASSNVITNRFTLDNGQRVDLYDYGAVVLKPGQADPGTITVTFDHYTTSGSGDYFSADSYPDYDVVPKGPTSKGLVDLRNCIDFRPRRGDGDSNAVTAADFDGTGAIHFQPPVNFSNVSTDILYHLPRVDILCLTKAGKFEIIKGVSDEKPRSPIVPDRMMALYKFKMKPYIFELNDVQTEYINNKRYTMKDIGKIENRVKNLEYYTSLSLLEQSAADVQIRDGSSNERLKNGFVVDNFVNHSVADVSNIDHQCSVDKKHGHLRPRFDERNVNLIRKAGEANGNGSNALGFKNKSLITLHHTGETFVNQPYSSFASNVNPYSVFSWGGMVDLSPESDEWKEVDVLPQIIIDDSNAYNQFLESAEAEGILGTVWNEWETNWAGTPFFDEDDNWQRGNPDLGFVGTTITSQNRTGISTEVAFDTIERSDGGKVVEVNFIPFIRSREINFRAQLMKPETTVFAFFDGVPVASFVRPETFSNSNPFEFSDRGSIVTHEGATAHPESAAALTTDASGRVFGSFVIPRNDVLKFACGIKEFRLSDSSTNNKTAETTFAEVQYHAQGLLETIQETVVSTKVPRLVTTELRADRTQVDGDLEDFTDWVDPLAETILIDKEGGIFARSIDVFFKKKDANIPVRLTIRTTENGVPTQRIVPGADKILYPADVNLPSSSTANNGLGNADNATTFTFDDPVYLAQDTEYAIVLTSQCDNYEVYVAEMGGTDLTNANHKILKNPYGGVFFTSQNASTWTPEQTKDLKFKLTRCKFGETSAVTTFTNDVLPPKLLGQNPLITTSGSGTVKVLHANHGMHGTGKVTITGATAGNGITAANLNVTNATIGNITHDSYTYTAGGSDTASATGSVGGAAVKATENRQMDAMFPVVSELQLPGTGISYQVTTKTGASIDGGQTPYAAGVTLASILPNRNASFTVPMSIMSQVNETASISAAKSFELKCTLTRESGAANDHLSPVIDMNRLSVHTIQNRLSSSTSVVETTATGGTELARYLTVPVELAEEADMFRVIVSVLRPKDSNVQLFYRTLPAGASQDIREIAFTEATPETPIPINDTQFNEIEFEEDPAGSYGVIQYKLVLTGKNSAKPPRVKDFRAISAT